MSYKTILVHVDTSKRCAARLDVACELVRAYDAHLTGLYILPDPFVAAYAAAGYVPAEFIEEQRERAAGEAARAEKAFAEHMKRQGIEAEWRTAEGNAAELVALNARYADVLVVGQAERENPVTDPELPTDVTMAAGRPVLVVPYAGTFRDIGKRIMVCWNASREATRAVNDALPLLQRAERVTVLAVNPEGGDQHGDVPGADISLYLARHGVRSEAAKTFAEDIDVADVILSRAADLGIDLLVMGAYGHARLQEWILGGVTRTIMRSMTVPVLISH